jgi:hypothetical protein
MENKHYGISFEVVIFSQIKLQLQNFPHVFFSYFLDLKTIHVDVSLDN